MFAYSYSHYGPPEVLTKITRPKPVPHPHEVLVRVHATTVSAADWRLRSLTMPPGFGWIGRLAIGLNGPRKPVLGTDFSGVIEAVGPKVRRFQPGDAVIGFPGTALGAHAEYITMPEDGVITLKPGALGHAEAAALPFGAMTAYDFLVNRGRLRAGERILINGASGSTGSACVQIARHLGAHITAVCSARNADLMRSLGAERVIDYQSQDFCADSARYDVVVDAVGNAPWSRMQGVLTPGGRMLMIAGGALDMILGGARARLAGKRLIAGSATESREILQAVVALAQDGVIRPVIDRCYEFDQMIDAHRHVDSGRKRGNVVVCLRPDDLD